MFPLGSVLLPGMMLPLRLFEPRYLKMYADIIDADREFGVVLIERGVESRDDNPTFEVGCTANVVGSGLNEDGTIGLVTVGRTRIRVREWKLSDPYPRAIIEDLPDDPLGTAGVRAVASAADRMPDLIGLAEQLSPGAEYELPDVSDDPAVALYQLAQLAGLQALDLQAVLEADNSDERAAMVDRFVAETAEMMRLQLQFNE